MKKLIFLLLLPLLLQGQLFRATDVVIPVQIIQQQTDTSKYAVLVRRKYASAPDKYFYISSRKNGTPKAVAFRYGDIYNTAPTQIPSGFLVYVAPENCGLSNGDVVAYFTNANSDMVFRQFGGQSWIVQKSDSNGDKFVVRGKNFLQSDYVTINNASVNSAACLAAIQNATTGQGGLEFDTTFPTPSGYEYVDGVYQLIGTPPPTGTTTSPTTAYKYPSGGLKRYFVTEGGSVQTFDLMNLQVSEVSGVATLTDANAAIDWWGENPSNYTETKLYVSGDLVYYGGQWYRCYATAIGVIPTNTSFFTPVTIEKKYYLGTGGVGVNTFSVSQMQTGINVNAYRGKEISIQAAYSAIGYNDLKLEQAKHMEIYIPSIDNTYAYSGGTYYEHHPSRTWDKYVHNFNSYTTKANLKIPSSHLITIDTQNEAERTTGTSYQSAGVHSKFATDNAYKYFFVGDNWLTDYSGHPAAYTGGDWNTWWANYKNTQGGLENARAAIRALFDAHVIQPFKNYDYVFLNNELKYYWSNEFKDIIKLCYEDWKVKSNGKLAAWYDTIFPIPVTPNKTNAWNDWNYSGTINNFNPIWVQVNKPGSLEYALGINQIGEYYLSPNIDRTLYKTIVGGLFAEKFNIPQKTISSTWRTVEALTETYSPMKFFDQWNGRTLEGYDKPTASGHLLRNMAAASCFFAKGFHAWDDGFSVSTTATAYYPNSGSGSGNVFLDGAKEGIPAGNPVKTNVPTRNVDSYIDGAWSVYQNADFLAATIQFADVLDGSTWRTGADAFVVGAWQDKKPFVAYRRVGNSYLVFAYTAYSTTVQDVQIRVRDSNNNLVTKTIQLKGDNVTIVKL